MQRCIVDISFGRLGESREAKLENRRLEDAPGSAAVESGP